jgi:hypothetical protein
MSGLEQYDQDPPKTDGRCKEAFLRHSRALISILLILVSTRTFASAVPSKTSPDQTVAARNADLTTSSGESDLVAQALVRQGFARSEVEGRLAQLSSQDVHRLAGGMDQLQAAGGVSRKQWVWMGVGAAIIILLLIVASQPRGSGLGEFE